PFSEYLLCAFAVSHIGLLASSTVRGCIAALKAWHLYLDLPWHGGPHLNLILNGVKNSMPSSSRHPLRPPVTCNMLLSLSSLLDLHSFLDSAVLAVATATFYGQCCLGKILSSWEDTFLDGHTVLTSHLSEPLSSNQSRKLFLPFTKVSKSRGKFVYICRQADASDPISALKHHLLINSPPSEVPLFSYQLSLHG
ncbi:hypothetical protein CONPUDRAFT_55019, partial [Coniophora puteana RWD-64-598 SS2]